MLWFRVAIKAALRNALYFYTLKNKVLGFVMSMGNHPKKRKDKDLCTATF